LLPAKSAVNPGNPSPYILFTSAVSLFVSHVSGVHQIHPVHVFVFSVADLPKSTSPNACDAAHHLTNPIGHSPVNA
jgi:hypothetical protein